MEAWEIREKFREDVIAFIDRWKKLHPEASFITNHEIPKILDVVSMEFVTRHHKERAKRGLNKHGEFL